MTGQWLGPHAPHLQDDDDPGVYPGSLLGALVLMACVVGALMLIGMVRWVIGWD